MRKVLSKNTGSVNKPKIEFELSQCLSDMMIPIRRYAPTYDNLRWLKKNLRANNKKHPNFVKVTEYVNQLLTS